jgi:hypothetical protein
VDILLAPKESAGDFWAGIEQIRKMKQRSAQMNPLQKAILNRKGRKERKEIQEKHPRSSA